MQALYSVNHDMEDGKATLVSASILYTSNYRGSPAHLLALRITPDRRERLQ